MRRQVDAQGLRGNFRDQGAHILDGELSASGRRDPERRFLRSLQRKPHRQGSSDLAGRQTQTTTFETGIRKTVHWYLDAK